MDVEELGRASIETDALALVDLALAVVGGDALLLAGLCEAVHHVGHELHLSLDGADLLSRGWLLLAKSEERHVGREVVMRCVVGL